MSILVDTGASSTIVSLALARELNLTISLHDDKGGGAGGGSLDVYVIEDTSIDLQELVIRPRHLLAMDLTHANEALIAFLAERLAIPRAKIALIAGATSRSKTLRITGKSAAEVAAALSTDQDA